MNKISIIIVTYNCESFIEGCINSILESSYKNYELIIVDNSSTDNTVNIIKKFNNIKLILSENKGFGSANNIGVKNSTGNYLFFLNPDTVLKKDSLLNVSNFLDENRYVDIVGAKLLWKDGNYQDSYKRFPTTFDFILDIFEIQFYFKNNIFNKRLNYDFIVFDEPTKVDWVIGAAFIIKREIFNELNGFDENFFMYCEEIDLCKRAFEKGHNIYFFPDFEVFHLKGQSSINTNVRSVEYYKSIYYYNKKHYGVINAFFVRFSIIVSCLIYISVLFFKFCFYKNKDIHLKKMKNKFILLKWCLGI